MEFAVLEMIHKLSAQHDAIYGAAISDLQKKMEILPSALSRLLRGMEEKGLCVRSIDPKDRRSSYVSLTETGQERREQKLQHSGMWMEWRNRTENVSATELFKTM